VDSKQMLSPFQTSAIDLFVQFSNFVQDMSLCCATSSDSSTGISMKPHQTKP